MSTPELRAQIIEATKAAMPQNPSIRRKRLPRKIGKQSLNRHVYRRVPLAMNHGNSCW